MSWFHACDRCGREAPPEAVRRFQAQLEQRALAPGDVAEAGENNPPGIWLMRVGGGVRGAATFACPTHRVSMLRGG